MDPQAQRPVSFFAMVTDKRSVQKAKVGASMTSLQTPRIPGERSPRRLRTPSWVAGFRIDNQFCIRAIFDEWAGSDVAVIYH